MEPEYITISNVLNKPFITLGLLDLRALSQI